MKVVFVQPKSRSVYEATPEPPLGLAYLASSLFEYKNDLNIKILDGNIINNEEYYEVISEIRADIIGVTSTIASLNEALKIPALVKEKSAIFILGGPGVTTLPSSRIYESDYSFICYGEGERTIVELVQALESGSSLEKVNGISFLRNGGEIRTPPREPVQCLDELPLPARDLVDMKRYLGIWKERLGVAATQIVSSRGCPFSCRFCSKSVSGKRARFMSPSKVIDEMRLLYEKYGAEMIFFDNDLFTLNKKWILEFCDAMERELPGKRWGAQARVGTVDLEMLSRMKSAGCTDLMFGVESGSQKILDFLGKGITVEQIKRTFELVNEAKINGGIYLIVGVPGECQGDIDSTKELIAKLRPKSIDMYFLTPIPGTEIYEMTKDLIREDADFFDFNESLDSVYKRESFVVDPKERMRELMDFFYNAIDERCLSPEGTYHYKYNRPTC